ncbi:MAG: AAA family ATPase, partial [Clostridia bacterium]|nr:AAA family ATPase [Clostridia bacterium]
YGCIGETLKHSFSAEIHPLLSSAAYELCEVPREELERFMQRRDFAGINVTIPYKQAVIPFLYEIDAQAREIGAVNTVVNRGGLLYGYNTDFYGMCALLEHLHADVSQKKAAILGTGGTSLTATAVLHHLGAREILRVSRSQKEGCITYETLLAQHRDVQILINTTPCGMYPHAQETPIDPKHFPSLECVADAVYNPLRTELVLRAREQGIPAEGGLYMLVAQAVRASEIFHDCTYPADTVERIWKKLMRQKENIVLIGMPGCGKTTVGQILATDLGREFCDMDVEISACSERTPAEIIAQDGERAFRDLESEVLCERISMRQGEIIATGGGAILRAENVRMLKQNGRLYWLDRPLEKLIPTEDRPLSSSREALERRYRERYAIYRGAADVTVSDPATAEAAAKRIREELEA